LKFLTGFLIFMSITNAVLAQNIVLFKVRWGTKAHSLGYYNVKNAKDFDEPWALGPISFKKTPSGDFLIVDNFNKKVKLFSANGKLLSSNLVPVTFEWLGDCFLDKQENLYVTDMKESRIYKFDKNGKQLLEFGGSEPGPDKFFQIKNLMVDNLNRIIVSDFAKGYICVFNQNGELLYRIKWERTGFAVDNSGNIYCLNYKPASKIQPRHYLVIKYDTNGKPHKYSKIVMPEMEEAEIRGIDENNILYVSFIEPMDRSKFKVLGFNKSGGVVHEFEYITMSPAEVQFFVDKDGDVYHLSYDASIAPEGFVKIIKLKKIMGGEG